MTNEPILRVRNLSCAYNSGDVVLTVNDLDLPSGQLIFVIGKSGIGKSTFIETLGVMNDTIVPHAGCTLSLRAEDGQVIEFKDCWRWSNEQLASFRRAHFSFIFQNTNLMPGFSSGENMAVSLLIKGHSFQDAKAEVLSMMKRLLLPENLFDKRVTEISGGQRQRLAFVRAITSDYSILFGDEPTGNLDTTTSVELMTVLKESIQQRAKTAVLVSHDLKLAERFADMIVPIVPAYSAQGTLQGRIDSTQILYKRQEAWTDSKGGAIVNPLAHLSNYLQ